MYTTEQDQQIIEFLGAHNLSAKDNRTFPVLSILNSEGKEILRLEIEDFLQLKTTEEIIRYIDFKLINPPAENTTPNDNEGEQTNS